MASYQYRPLSPNGSNIRLLRLLPDQDPTNKINCEIFHADITNADRPAYEALSYTWGDASQTVAIGLNDFVFPATINLDAALRALRMNDRTRTLWVDAVCINQGDVEEQGAQVRMMWDIYRAADCVLVWLGPEEGDSAVAMASMARQETQIRLAAREMKRERPEGYIGPGWCGCHAGDFDTHPPRIGVQNLLGRAWFKRVWVLQEVAAAKQVLVVCGDKTLSGDDFYREIIGVASFHSSFQKIVRRIRPALELMSKSTTDSKSPPLPILELIECFRTWDATKPVDKVFALLGFSSDTADARELQPNYAMPQDVLAQNLIRLAFRNCIIAPQSEKKDEVAFEVEGLLLGTISGKSSGYGKRAWSFNATPSDSKLPNENFNSVAFELFQTPWEIRILNERRLQFGSSVVLLRGATRPTVLCYREGQYTVEMLATPEPFMTRYETGDGENGWPSALKALSEQTDGLMKFKLSWDPFRQPHSSEISRYTPAPNNIPTQWEAMIESLRDKAETERKNSHDCRTMTMLWLMYRGDKNAIKAGSSKYTMTLHKAAYFGYYGTVKLLIDANVGIDDLETKLGTTALHLAAQQGHTKVVRALLDAKATVDSLNKSDETPLDLAAAEDHSDICQMLLDAGADLKRNATTIFVPAVKGHINTVKVLLDAGADANAVDGAGSLGEVSALHLAAELGNKEVVDALLAAGARVDPRTATDTTPLHQAAMNGHTEVVRLLIDAGANINARDDNGVTPLDFAVYRNQHETAEEIFQAGGNQHVTGQAESAEEDDAAPESAFVYPEYDHEPA